MDAMIWLLIASTVALAGFNIFVKLVGDATPASASTPVLANLVLSSCQLGVQVVYWGASMASGATMKLTARAYGWAAAGGVTVGLADIAYFYLFSGFRGGKPMAASVATPTVVAGAVVLTMVVSIAVLGEAFRWTHVVGGTMIVGGMVVLYLPGK